MKKVCILAPGLAAIFSLTACANHYLATVSLDNALTDYGRINSYDLPLGTVLLWHQKSGEIDSFVPILRKSLPLERTPETGTQDQVSIKGVSETDVAVTTPPLSNLPVLDAKTTLGIQAAVGSATQLELDQYFLENYDGPYAMPNDPSTVDWRRQNLNAQLADPDIVFVFVTADTTSNTAKFYTGTPTDSSGNAKALDSSLTIAGNKIVDVSYTRGSSITKTGAGIPSIVKYQYYRLKTAARAPPATNLCGTRTQRSISSSSPR